MFTGGVFSHDVAESCDVWGVGSVRKEFTGHDQGFAKDHFCGREFSIIFWCCSEAEEDPGKLWQPGTVVAAGHQGRLEGSVESFHHTVCFGVVGCGVVEGGAQ